MAIKRGTSKRDVLSGTAANDSLFGLGGNDDLFGRSGNDKLYGGTGNDRLFGEAGNDILDGGTGADRMTGGRGSDTYLVDNAGDRVIETAGQGIDLVKSSVTHTLAANVENLLLTGSASISGTGNLLGNTLTGNSGANTLSGGSGNDRLLGGGGNDTLNGGDGDDFLAPGIGTDSVDGGAGADTLSYSDATSGVTLSLTLAHTVTVGGAAAGDSAIGIEGLIGSAFADTLTLMAPGADTSSFAFGGSGNDLVTVANSNAVSDTFVRVLRGDDGNDTLRGDQSTAALGNPTTDHFWLQYDRGFDVVRFFNGGEDKLLISAKDFNLPANLVGQALPAAQFLTSSDSFAQTQSQQLIFETDTGILWADKDGTGDAFASIPIARFDATSNFVISDFLIIA